MTDTTEDYKQQIEALLSNYVDGRDIFKVAQDYDHPVTRVPEAESRDDLPTSWLELAENVIGLIAHKKYGIDTYPNVIAIIDSEQMLDAYANVGMPVSYDHWSFGKERANSEKNYAHGRMGLAYEIVINTNPAIAYCMTQNTKLMQMLVIAHASFGHNSFFKGNHLFRQFTDAQEIILNLTHLKEFVMECEERYGEKEVTKLLDACHALQSYGVNRSAKPFKRTPKEEEARRKRIEEIRQLSYDHLMETTLKGRYNTETEKKKEDVVFETEENILRFIAGSSPHLQPWQRDLIRKFCDKAQYFYPQMQTQLMNEGWATFWHHTLLNDLYDIGLIDDGMMLEFIQSHTGVVYQPSFDSPNFSGRLNPYALGFAMFKDIQRICMDPTDEDRKWFPDFAGCGDWVPVVKFAMESFKDESFVLQYLSPKLIRDFRLFSMCDDDKESEIVITSIHDDAGYRRVRADLSAQYNLGNNLPTVEVTGYDYKETRTLTLQHKMHNRKPLDEADTNEVLKHIHALWGHPIVLQSVDEEKKIVNTIGCPPIYKPAPAPVTRGFY